MQIENFEPIKENNARQALELVHAMVTPMSHLLSVGQPKGLQASRSTALCAILQSSIDLLQVMDRRTTGQMLTLLGSFLTDREPNADAFYTAMHALQVTMAKSEISYAARKTSAGSA